jgi:FkbM family methyltransferase
MKLEEKIKEKYLYSTGFNLFKNLYFYIQKLKSNNYIKKSYSGGAQDLIINYFFQNKKKGVYIDVGCYHPYNGNNTKLLYDRGWSGINIAISEKKGEKDLYFFHNRSAINSLSEIRKKEAKEIKRIKTKTLNSIIENSKFKDEKINLLSIDVEGHEIEVLRSVDLNKYFPEMIVIEFLERDILDNMEFHNQNIDQIINSDIYQHMIKNGYHFVNWLHSDLIFVHNSVRK